MNPIVTFGQSTIILQAKGSNRLIALRSTDPRIEVKEG